jgi:hypothetical protein
MKRPLGLKAKLAASALLKLHVSPQHAMRTVHVLAAASALLFVAMALYTSPLDPGIPAIQFTFTEAGFSSVLNAWRPADIARFRAHFAIDFPFLACYGALGLLLTRRTGLFRHTTRRTKSLLAASLPVAAAADATENALHLYFLYRAAPGVQALYFAAGFAASVKWLLIATFVCCSVYALRRHAASI